MLLGEVERLLKEYRQNQELVRRIGKHYYQIIYPVQLRHHEKMGISTREVGASKVRNRLRKRNSLDTVCFIQNSSNHPSYTIKIKKWPSFNMVLTTSGVVIILISMHVFDVFFYVF